MLKRRRFIAASAVGVGFATRAWVGGAERAEDSRFESFDHEIKRFMDLRGVPGGALAVVKDRRLVYARGYGWADKEGKVGVTARSLFRIASVSKPITAVAVLQLVEEGKLSLSSRAFELLDLGLLDVEVVDPRWRRVTVEQLLKHTGGWDRDVSFDPMFRCRPIAKAMKVESPPGPWEVIRFMAGQPLDFDPGARFAYSNFGYCLLGRILEKVTGEGYEEAVQSRVLKPIGIERMRVGGSLPAARVPGEVRYYMPDDERFESVFGGGEAPARVPAPYGGFNLGAMDAHGGWVASVIDLGRFAAALDAPEQSPLLRAGTFNLMYAPPAPPVSREADGGMKGFYYGCGWNVRPLGAGGANYWHTGSLPGTSSLLVRRGDGVSWAVVFNQRSRKRDLPDSAIDGAMHRAAARVTAWPDGDLFGEGG